MLNQEKIDKLQIDLSQAKKLLIDQLQKQLEMLDDQAAIIKNRQDAVLQILKTLKED